MINDLLILFNVMLYFWVFVNSVTAKQIRYPAHYKERKKDVNSFALKKFPKTNEFPRENLIVQCGAPR
jgi:hypothetical protein